MVNLTASISIILIIITYLANLNEARDEVLLVGKGI